ncbi:MAG: peptidoglycan DD-metalloendopeptidase family protein [Campylobacteraceae bacterium]
MIFKKIVIFLLFVSSLFGAYVEESSWNKGETFLNFLENNNIPLSLYYNLDNEDKEFASEVYAGMKYFMLKNEDGDTRQILIPIGGELQIHIYKENDGNYTLNLTPVSYIEERKELAVNMEISPYQDILDKTGNALLAYEFVNAFKGSVDFKRLRAGAKVVILYDQKTRLGSQMSNPRIIAALVENRGREDYIFLYDKNRYFDKDGKELEGFFLTIPLKYTRISSPFTLKRWHPVLKKYRAHLGIDYAAPKGTPVKAAGNGKVTFVGVKNGYGNTVTISHANGYMTLYAHLNGFKKGLKAGQSVNKGELIAYVGSTGVSTGPHIHLGLYKNNQAINPNSVIQVTKSALAGKEKKAFLEYAKEMKDNLANIYENANTPIKEQAFTYMVNIDKE